MFTTNYLVPFSGLFNSLVLLASSTEESFLLSGKGGHIKLIHSTVTWLVHCKEYLSQKNVVKKIDSAVPVGTNSTQRHYFFFEAANQMLCYLADVFEVLEYKFFHAKSASEQQSKEESSKADEKMNVEQSEEQEAVDLDEEDEEDEGEDEELCSKLCTFTLTAQEFINQHWYHCHTCNMIEGEGVCTVCAQVCHRGHDVTYAKQGSFFCDCGAKANGSCRALTPRTPSAKSQNKKAKKSDPSQVSKLNLKKFVRFSKYWNQNKESLSKF